MPHLIEQEEDYKKDELTVLQKKKLQSKYKCSKKSEWQF